MFYFCSIEKKQRTSKEKITSYLDFPYNEKKGFVKEK